MGISLKKYMIHCFCADQIDVITNFAVITNVVLKRVHCIGLPLRKRAWEKIKNKIGNFEAADEWQPWKSKVFSKKKKINK